ncbi:16S rRNA processing protein RimM [Caldanaerobacter subterraneus subsp. tengcongensis MB4]|uniref:Ribosome maturation factor RimM n=1 Tax=Caldanaerobacter subterraneus subsp. tengcongensis (strain DSM 15242 / JCM 11007 / NBRC 100824 / MB4) TaxID=273068 RepID=RIMM_CALS4|nr:ribosome maturation factor RimM [Caldanaerobacter subterraneus]Q8R9X3.1 RecName: Full=Ribosome maturation factor RimM [Caldanaerobacter subterraneus subsp. tengcongensis MB4]AAM24681.1 RimM protein, required for 16S rRNA processing [Caldanaerobacter subterraneus subsp. tengcongensis MB4]MCS3915757.1 16S rRNA processing protein RimM [Caldanaerobacter subterraneus subsp. tengcongensis MB4]
MADYYNVGKVTSPHGIRGEIKVYPLTNVPERFYDIPYIWVFDEKDIPCKYEIENVKITSKGMVLLKLKGIDSRNDAEKLKGLFLKVDAENALKLEEDEYFITDLIGMKVYTEEGELIGTLEEVLQTGANDVYVVKAKEREVLLPAIKEVIKKVDVEGKVMIVRLLEGL